MLARLDSDLLSLVRKFVSEKARLESEEQRAEEELLLLHQEFEKFQRDFERRSRESVARLIRLRRQKESLTSKGKVLVERGLEDLDELEAEEAARSAVPEAPLLPLLDPEFDWDSVGLDLSESFTLDPSSTSVGVVESSGGS